MHKTPVDTIRVTINLDERNKDLKAVFGNLPLGARTIFNLVFKLWELGYKNPAEFVDELFSAVTYELHESPELKRQLADANRLNEETHLTQSDVADRLTNLAVSKINAAIRLLDVPLRATLKPIIDSHSASISDVKLGLTSVGVFFDVILTVNPSICKVGHSNGLSHT